MKLLLSILLIVLGMQASAKNNSLVIKDPLNASYRSTGFLQDVAINVTPKGIYAQVELVMTIANATPAGNTQYESVLAFELPYGSFVHDSWLWLDSARYVVADIKERTQATQTYLGIVKRRVDPSLLVKTLNNCYQLNVYPLRYNYARKVKITYSTPFIWQKGKAIVALPTALLSSSATAPDFTLTLNTTTDLTAPAFLNAPFNSLLISKSGNVCNLQVPASTYSGANGSISDLLLAYAPANPSNALLTVFPTDASEGVYQCVVPAVTNATTSPRNFVFLLDQYDYTTQYYNYGYMLEPLSQVVRNIRSSLIQHLMPTDSFNIFYVKDSAIVQASPSWVSVDSANIQAITNSIIYSPTIQKSQLRKLLYAGLPFANTSPSAQVILIATDPSYNSSLYADTLVDKLKAHLGGSFKRINIIENTRYASSLVYKKLSHISGGIHITSKGSYYDNYSANNSADLDLAIGLRQILQEGATTNVFTIDLPMIGVLYSEYPVLNNGIYNPSSAFSQLGRYYGNWTGSGSIQLSYKSGSGLLTANFPVARIDSGSSHAHQSWIFHYMNELKSLNANGNYRTAIVDSSINNRVLTEYTAFLAVEPDSAAKLSISNPTKSLTASAYPNPFTTKITISCQMEVASVTISDMLGRIVWESKPLSKTFIWDGRDKTGANLPAGFYLVKVVDKQGNYGTVKVQKL